MSSTITCGKRVGAFAKGAIVYISLWEKTYESNVHPYDPSWSCVYFGTTNGALRRIFTLASSCEGGMLVATGKRRIRPENYISAWLRELAAPRLLPNTDVELRRSNMRPPIEQTPTVDRLLAKAVAHGLDDAVAEYRATGKASLPLYDHPAFFSECYAEGLVPSWRVLEARQLPSGNEIVGELAYRPRPVSRFEILRPTAFRIDDDERLMQRADGSWHPAGWEYTIVGDYISDLWQTEILEPGSYRKRIPEYRDAIESAPRIPDGTFVRVLERLATADHERKSISQFKAKFSHRSIDGGFEVSPTQGNLDHLCRLSHTASTWILPRASGFQAAATLVTNG